MKPYETVTCIFKTELLPSPLKAEGWSSDFRVIVDTEPHHLLMGHC